MKIQIGMVDDHILLRDSLCFQIDNFPDCEVILQANHGQAMIEEIRQGKVPDLMIVDLYMDVMDGFEVTEWLFDNYPGMNVLILSMNQSEYHVIRLLRMGVKAFLNKDAELSEMKNAIESVMKLGTYFPPSMTRSLTRLYRHPENQKIAHKFVISENERVFLTLICKGLTYTAIAREMNVSPRTIENYRNRLTERFELKTKTGLAAYAIKNGIVVL